MMPTSVVVRWTSCTSRGTSGGTTAKNADSAENRPPAKRTNFQEVPAPRGLSRSGSSASGSAIANSPASPFGPGQGRVRLRQSGDPAQNLRFLRAGDPRGPFHDRCEADELIWQLVQVSTPSANGLAWYLA